MDATTLRRAELAQAAGALQAAERTKAMTWRWLALGASIGGPAALRDLLAELPVPSPLRVVVVQHIAPGSEVDLVDWLAGSSGLDVRLAVDGERPPPGSVRLAPAGAHLRVTSRDRLELDAGTPPRGGHRPSVDELFLSLAMVAPHDTAGALLSGSGSDGAAGLAALGRAGALCLVQDEASSAAFGMPRAALELGAVALALSPSEIGRELRRRLRQVETTVPGAI
jgi:two-component system chemotaxis response regulator CheB